ncbi:MAG: DUF6504 family protein [Microcella sp.]|mgnify:CR=1 FL=1
MASAIRAAGSHQHRDRDEALRDRADAPDAHHAVVWSDDAGRPLRLIWRGRRWRVTDRPTVITAPVSWWWRLDPDGVDLDLAPAECAGWRFQATGERGETRVFDIRDTGDPRRWLVVKTYC